MQGVFTPQFELPWRSQDHHLPCLCVVGAINYVPEGHRGAGISVVFLSNPRASSLQSCRKAAAARLCNCHASVACTKLPHWTKEIGLKDACRGGLSCQHPRFQLCTC